MMATHRQFTRTLARLSIQKIQVVKVWRCPITNLYSLWPSSGLQLVGTGIEFLTNQ